jgi:hypothetical protein
VAAWDQYGRGNTKPTTSIFRYTPEQLGNQPFIQQLQGRMKTVGWQGFAQPLSNPDIGVTSAPAVINAQRYRDMNSSSRDAVESLYSQGLEQDMRDMLDRSQRATAGLGAGWGRMGGYGR